MKLPTDGQAFTAHVRQWLEDQAQKTDTEFPANTAARFERGRLVLRRLTARPIPPALAALQEVILNRVQPTTILDALADTLAWLGWSRPFGPISGFDDKLTDPSLRYLITVFCYGCQLGPAQTARILRTMNRRQISWINQRHIIIESLNKAIEILIKGFEQFALPVLWGSPKRAAADGTKWSMYEQNLLAEQHIRYGGVGGIGYYHVASTCIAIFSNFIACGAWEGTYLLDFFEQYAAITQPNTIHADTQGQTAPLFGLAYLMGVTLIPRIRNWQDLTMYRASATSTYEHIDSLFTEMIDWRLIATHLPDMLRIVLSIKTGTLTPSTILRMLNSENQHNLVYRAFRELGRAVRTKTLLQILADVDLRHTMQDASNKNEAFNRFTKWVAFGSAGVITGNDREEQRKFVKYNHLVANCLIVYNTTVLTNILHELAAEGHPLDPDAVAAFSPYLQRTIDRFGRYEIDPERSPSSLRFDISSSLPPATNDEEPLAQA